MGERSNQNPGLTFGVAVGCFAAFTFGTLSLFGIFLGSVMGDCLPDVDCKKDVGGNLIRAALVVVPVALILGFAWRWLTNATMPVLTRYLGFGLASFLMLFSAVVLSAMAGWHTLPLVADLILAT